MNDLTERPQLPLTKARKALVATGAMLFLAQIAAAILLAPPTTGPGDSNPAMLAWMWAAAITWSVATVLCVVRQTDLPDVATASMLVAISTAGAFALSAAFDARGDGTEVNLTDALFLGVTGGALTGMIVWGAATAVARALHLPTTAHLTEQQDGRPD